MRTGIICLLLTVAGSITLAQQDLPMPDIFFRRALTPSVSVQPRSERPMQYRIPGKKASQYTPQDWGTIIDSTWGPGQSGAEQLQIFDTFFNLVRQQWAGFPNLALGCSYWDSVRNVYRPQIGVGLSRGRFYALMSRMWLALSELHTYIFDLKVDTTFGLNTLHYRRGVPLLIIGPWVGNMLGAAVTPLADSTNLVYRAASDNPLGLVPGDLILGYEGVPWKHLYRQLLDAGLPVSYWYSWPGSTPASMTHFFLMAVGHNWGLFDTIDVVKFSSGDTVHLPTALLDTIVQTVWPSDQAPVAGVPMPQAPGGPVAVSWGVVQGTNTGYIYVWDWASTQTQTLFSNAVNDLVHIRRVKGLVLDFRMNWGGNFTYGNNGLLQLFNIDPTSNLRRALRNNATDCMSFALSAAPGAFIPTALYDHPIAVLVGPGAFSVGDYNALRMRFHPMARLFGKPTNGAFVAGTSIEGSLSGGWPYLIPTSQVYSNMPGEGYLMHDGLRPDEEVWLTRAGVANGEDDVVKRALAWMDSLSYVHDVKAINGRNQGDSILITARVENSSHHALVVSAIITDGQNALVDSVVLRSVPGDTIVAAFIGAPTTYQRYYITVRTDDHTLGSVRRLFRVAWFFPTPSIVPALGGVLYGASTNLYTMSRDSGIATSIGVIPYGPIQGLAVRPSTRELYGVSSTNHETYLYRISSDQGADILERTIPVPYMRAIAFSRGDTLFGATTNGNLYRIDLTSGSTIPIGAATGKAYSGLCFSPRTGKLWASVREPSSNDSLFVVDCTTGAATFAFRAGWPMIVPSMAFSPGDTLYGLLGDGGIYLVRIDSANSQIIGETWAVRVDAIATHDLVTSVDERLVIDLPGRFSLYQNHPNPFNPSTTIAYELPTQSCVTVKVYDVLGREVATLVNEVKSPGTYTAQWDASRQASGVYFYRLSAGSFVDVKKLLLLK